MNSSIRMGPSSVTPNDYGAVENATISWRAIFAGTAVALLTYMILMSLGLAVGGHSLQGIVQNQNSASGLGIGSGIWLAVSTLVSLFVGSYTASRVSGLIPMKVGRTQGLVVTALFFGLMFSQIGSALGTLGKGVGTAVGALGSGVSDLSKNSQVQDIVGRSVEGLNLKSSPEVVVQGVASRLLQGNQQGAINYLSLQAGISPTEAQARIDGFRQDFDQTMTQAGVTAAKVAKIAGWSIFGALVLGSLASLIGGGLGAGANLARPLDRSDHKALGKSRAA